MGIHFDQAIGIFFRDVPVRIQEICESIPVSDMKSLQMNAHTIRGGARYLGLDRLEAVCHRLETLAQKQLANEGNSLMVELQTQFELAHMEVTKLLASDGMDRPGL